MHVESSKGLLPREPALGQAPPTRAQVAKTRAVMEWYLATHYGRPDEPGVPSMFCRADKVGAFAISQAAYVRGEGDALFRLLIATTMFQRLQDVLILRILRGISADEAADLSSAQRLLALVDGCDCPHAQSTAGLREVCDLAKDPASGAGVCAANPAVRCHLKQHTVLLKRYGHFGKVPSSAALTLREAGVSSLPELRDAIFTRLADPYERAAALEAALSRAWRINQKIASMFLSAVSNPDLAPGGYAPWAAGLDWGHFVVIDSNVDLFLASIGYRGGRSYDERRAFVQALARRIDLSALDRRLAPYNPRLVQQAMYVFMSAANRRALPQDCMRLGPDECDRCPHSLATRCPVRQQAASETR